MTEKDYSAIPSIDKAIEVRVAGRKNIYCNYSIRT